MKVLFLGGTGNISTACVELALGRGHEVTLLTRGLQEYGFGGRARHVAGDRNDAVLLERVAAEGRYDVVANFIGYTTEEIRKDIAAFSGKTAQYLFISTAAVYRKPAPHYLIAETSPLGNAFWAYGRLKIACEELLLSAHRESGFPVTVVRPSYTYGPTWIPSSVGGHGYTVLGRMRRGLPVISHGDGQSLWVMTSHEDFAAGFVGLFGLSKALGEAYHITSDEVLTWDQVYQEIGRAAGLEIELLHLSSDLIAAIHPPWGGSLLGDKAYSTVFDNSKIKAAVPGFQAATSFAAGIRKSVEWHDARPDRRVIDEKVNAVMDHLVAVYREAASRGLRASN
jgi:nucleoside-diphosphate-sugar epimerase